MTDKNHATDVEQFFADLDAGVFAEKLGRALSDVAAGVVDNGKKGQITITLNLSRISDSQQVEVSSKLASSRPTARGKVSEEDTTATPMYVGPGGQLSLFPDYQRSENQGYMFSREDTE